MHKQSFPAVILLPFLASLSLSNSFILIQYLFHNSIKTCTDQKNRSFECIISSFAMSSFNSFVELVGNKLSKTYERLDNNGYKTDSIITITPNQCITDMKLCSLLLKRLIFRLYMSAFEHLHSPHIFTFHVLLHKRCNQ